VILTYRIIKAAVYSILWRVEVIMEEDCRNPSLRLRAAAEVIHKAAVHYHWVGRFYEKTYLELEKTAPIGFEEFNEIVAAALEAADQVGLSGDTAD